MVRWTRAILAVAAFVLFLGNKVFVRKAHLRVPPERSFVRKRFCQQLRYAITRTTIATASLTMAIQAAAERVRQPAHWVNVPKGRTCVRLEA
jgi:hypothetical protein